MFRLVYFVSTFLRYVLFALVLLSFLRVAPATIAYTAGTGCTTAATVTNLNCTIGAVNTGDMVWIGVSWAGGACINANTVTDGVNTYSLAGTPSQAGTTSARSAIYYTVATTTASLVVNVNNGGPCFITISPGVITGQAGIGETLKSNGTSVQSCTIGFTRSGVQLLTMMANDNVASSDVGWSTSGSGTFTLGAHTNNGVLNQPGAAAFQRVTSGTAINGVLAVTAAAGGMACSGLSINEAGANTSLQHRVIVAH